MARSGAGFIAAALIAVMLGAVAPGAAQPLPRPRPDPAQAAPVAEPLPVPPPAAAEPLPPAVNRAPPAPAAIAQRPCAELDHADWGDNERWIWQRSCAGAVADFNSREPGTANANLPRRNPAVAGVWDASRLVKPAFLPTILFREPYRSALPPAGVRIEGAWFAEHLDLTHGRFPLQLRLDYSRFDGAVDLTDAWFGTLVSLDGSALAHPLTMTRTQVGELFSARRAVLGGEVAAAAARIARLDLEMAELAAGLDMTGTEIGGDLLLRRARVANDAYLMRARVGGLVDLSGAQFNASLAATGLRVGGDLLMVERARVAGTLSLAGARIAGKLDATGAGFTGWVDMEGLDLGGSLLLRQATLIQPAAGMFAAIGGHLDLSGARLVGLDLTGTRVAAELRLGAAAGTALRWGEGARLRLNQARVGTLSETFDRAAWAATGRLAGWPAAGGLDLADFAYDRLGGADAAVRPIESRLDWLALDPGFSLQPFEQLAGVLRAAGQGADADTVLYAGRERARAAAWSLGNRGDWLRLSVLNLTVGYGYGARPLRLLGWVVLLTLVGGMMLRQSPRLRSRGLSWAARASFLTLVPFVQRKRDYLTLVNEEGSRASVLYLQAHRLAGYLLAALLLAGFAGLTRG